MIALQWSGGKDSTAVLMLLEKSWHKMTVYWLNSGDAFPETTYFVRRIAEHLPNFVEVQGAQPDVIKLIGMPSDLVPFPNSPVAWQMMVGEEPKIIDRGTCCYFSKMLPLHNHMREDGVTTVIRGQKDCDRWRGPLEDGAVVEGVKYLYPIKDWSDEMVLSFLKKRDAMPPLYKDGIMRSGDCMTCSAWLGDNRSKYVREYYPDKSKVLEDRLDKLTLAIAPHFRHLVSSQE